MNEEITEGRRYKILPVLVEPKYQGNIGFVARGAKNFGLDEIAIVNPPPIGDQAIAFSMHGSDILESARSYKDLEEVSNDVDYLIGTSGVWSAEKCYARNPMTPDEMTDWLQNVEGKVGLVFGREDIGLKSQELMLCDGLVSIPANPEYPVLNLSHAASLLFYEIYKSGWVDNRRNSRPINGNEKRILLEHYDRLMEICKVPDHKKPIASTNFRRMINRSLPTVREFHSLMGTFSRAMDYKENRKRLEEG